MKKNVDNVFEHLDKIENLNVQMSWTSFVLLVEKYCSSEAWRKIVINLPQDDGKNFEQNCSVACRMAKYLENRNLRSIIVIEDNANKKLVRGIMREYKLNLSELISGENIQSISFFQIWILSPASWENDLLTVADSATANAEIKNIAFIEINNCR